MNSKKILLIALLLALITSLTVYVYLQKVQKGTGSSQVATVIVAKKDIPARTLITSEMVEVKEVPTAYVHPQAATQMSEVANSITLDPIVQGEQVLKTRLTNQSEAKGGLSFTVPKGKRAVTVAVDEVRGVAGLLKPGDRVDVLTTIDLPMPGPAGSGEINRPYTVVVLQDVEVLAQGKTLGEVKTDSKNPSAEAKTVTLAVTLTQAQPLIMASERGSLRLLLRSPIDQGKVETQPFELRDMINGEKIPPTGAN